MADESFECPICMETCSEPQALPCAHVFCHICVRRLCLRPAPTCPLCRVTLKLGDIDWPVKLRLCIGEEEGDDLNHVMTLGPNPTPEEQEAAHQFEMQEALRSSNLRMSREQQEGLLVDYGVPLEFSHVLACKTVISGRKRNSVWTQCDSKEYIFVAQSLASVLQFCSLADELGWTFEFADGSTYVHNPPVLRYRACADEVLEPYGLVRANDPRAVENSIFPNQRKWWVLPQESMRMEPSAPAGPAPGVGATAGGRSVSSGTPCRSM
mmetsp:Transcript_107530/g.302677  ORF Transcript_107530/g.302677 Transcript_107530/m.302677 type:complete len:267 (+) Transcript_107530:105-905(+)